MKLRKLINKPRNRVKSNFYHDIYAKPGIKNAIETIRKAKEIREAVDALYTFVSFHILLSKYWYVLRCWWYRIEIKIYK